jgi:hypothetical protein
MQYLGVETQFKLVGGGWGVSAKLLLRWSSWELMPGKLPERMCGPSIEIEFGVRGEKLNLRGFSL